MVQRSTYEDIHILNLHGSILQSESEVIRKYLENYLSSQNYKIVVNLLETNHICSSALGHIVYMKNKFNKVGGDIRVVVNDEDLLELFEITTLDQVFMLFDNFITCANSF